MSLAGISSTGRIWSTSPVAMALRRMLSYWAEAGVWAMAMPPYSLTAWRPRVPSVPVPERMMQTAYSPWSSASERKK